ncbi:hypothetical protein HPP92_025742 [Vanilla planifolia]|uniref:Uncharacterized protein n=1 Tax=Vanilla planifolia TaxID=51239 RepID=A0A835PKP0_VANPL|nr:hypothetical protein HPP92_025742 [Vanilla planifolia]
MGWKVVGGEYLKGVASGRGICVTEGETREGELRLQALGNCGESALSRDLLLAVIAELERFLSSCKHIERRQRRKENKREKEKEKERERDGLLICTKFIASNGPHGTYGPTTDDLQSAVGPASRRHQIVLIVAQGLLK